MEGIRMIRKQAEDLGEKIEEYAQRLSHDSDVADMMRRFLALIRTLHPGLQDADGHD